ncbi:MAG: ABC transporter substrate-binding protein, partial [Bacillota bacterium]
AFAMSLDKRPIVETITRLGERVAGHYVPPGSLPGYASPKGIGLDVAGAQRLLAEAGYPQGKGFPRIRLTYATGAQHGDIAQQVRRQWLENLGVDVELEPIESAIFTARLHNREYELARASWFGDYNDVSTFTDKYLSSSDDNDAGWKNAEYDRLCDLAAREPDQGKRLGMLSQAEQILLDEAPIIPVYYYVNKFMFRENVKGIALSPRNMIMFQAVEVVR